MEQERFFKRTQKPTIIKKGTDRLIILKIQEGGGFGMGNKCIPVVDSC